MLSLSVEVLLHALREVALQAVFLRLLAFGLDAFVLYALLAKRTFSPARARTLVATDVDVLRGEDLDDFIEHVLYKLEGLLLARAEHVGKDTPCARNLIRAARAAQLGIGSQRSEHVAGHVDFGDDSDKTVGSILHNLAALLLRVETAVALAVVDA